ncbi:MAG: N-6 DNA methylase, partial [Chloroflexota bacterium]
MCFKTTFSEYSNGFLGFKAQYPGEEDTSDKNLKRKLQGIYYTPQYVVRYIVQQTLGRLLSEGRDVMSLRVLDPACGSGAFLIEAFDVLRRAYTTQYPEMPIAEVTHNILTKNLYGVDLDDQAVEVTRLNLSLRGAMTKGLLPTLVNIKHGNSLIADDDIAGEQLGFDWAIRFPDVIEAGGFDAVIGNPPYVRQETLGAQFKDYAKERYETYAGTADLYVYFIERGFSLLRDGGRMGYIVPNKWMRANYGKNIRVYLKDKIEELVDFGDLPVFAEATTYPCIIELSKDATDKQVTAATIKDLDFGDLGNHLQGNTYEVARDSLKKGGWALVSQAEQELLEKVKNNNISLKDFIENKIYLGIKTGLNTAFVIDEKLRRHLVEADAKNADLIKPYLAGRDVKRYQVPSSGKYLILIPNGWTTQCIGQETNDDEAWAWFSDNYKALADYLKQFEAKARKRGDKGEFWWE